MFWYPVQRHRLPDRAQRTSSSVGSGLASRSALAVIIMPGVQNPHCSPCSSLKPSCSGCSSLAVARPSTVEISCPSAWTASIVHDFTAVPSTRTVPAAHEVGQQQPGLDLGYLPLAVDREPDPAYRDVTGGRVIVNNDRHVRPPSRCWPGGTTPRNPPLCPLYRSGSECG